MRRRCIKNKLGTVNTAFSDIDKTRQALQTEEIFYASRGKAVWAFALGKVSTKRKYLLGCVNYLSIFKVDI